MTGPPLGEATITLARVHGQSFDGPFVDPKGWSHQKFIAPVIAGILTSLVSLAYASPVDPAWIPGIYDNADYDDVVGLVTDGTGASSVEGAARVEQDPVARIWLSEPSLVPKGMLPAQKGRGPPFSVGSPEGKRDEPS